MTTEEGNLEVGLFYFGKDSWNEQKAMFIGIKDKVPKWRADEWITGKENDFAFVPDLMFHSSWDWLMPTIKKIKALEWKDDGNIGMTYVEIFNYLDDCDIDNTFKSVTKFIQWYNQNKGEL